jgi:hypothetical protein
VKQYCAGGSDGSRIRMFQVVDNIRVFSRGAAGCFFYMKELVVDNIADDNERSRIRMFGVSIGRVGRYTDERAIRG